MDHFVLLFSILIVTEIIVKYLEFNHLRIVGPLVIDVNDTKQSYSFILYDKTLGMPFYYGKAMFSYGR